MIRLHDLKDYYTLLVNFRVYADWFKLNLFYLNYWEKIELASILTSSSIAIP